MNEGVNGVNCWALWNDCSFLFSFCFDVEAVDFSFKWEIKLISSLEIKSDEYYK